MSDTAFEARVAALAARLGAASQRLATAESCTGGWVAKVCTDRAGSSDWFEAGVVAYSNTAKQSLLGVPGDLIVEHGAVSRAVAEAMARGALAATGVQWSVALTGIAGPGGGTPDKPVGTVWTAWGLPDGGVDAVCSVYVGDRDAVRAASVAAALDGLLARIPAGG
ncbi:MAG: CinA family protein [Salinisphaeraceae bacterium]